MPSKRVPSPKDTITIRRLPAKGETVQLTATVTRVDPNDADTRWDRITVKIPGYSIPVTLHVKDIAG